MRGISFLGFLIPVQQAGYKIDDGCEKVNHQDYPACFFFIHFHVCHLLSLNSVFIITDFGYFVDEKLPFSSIKSNFLQIKKGHQLEYFPMLMTSFLFFYISIKQDSRRSDPQVTLPGFNSDFPLRLVL